MCAEKFSDLFAFMQFCVARKVIKQIFVIVEFGADNDRRETNEKES